MLDGTADTAFREPRPVILRVGQHLVRRLIRCRCSSGLQLRGRQQKRHGGRNAQRHRQRFGSPHGKNRLVTLPPADDRNVDFSDKVFVLMEPEGSRFVGFYPDGETVVTTDTGFTPVGTLQHKAAVRHNPDALPDSDRRRDFDSRRTVETSTQA
ncbi:hypothetical protein GMD84_14165, partial [Parabacteroides merdae]|nr:hypothetical protein [Parabacteroides merdae]